MFSHSGVLPNVWLDLLASILAFGLFGVVGRLLGHHQMHGDDPYERWVAALVTGMLFTVGVGVTIQYGHLGQHSLISLLLAAASFIAWQQRRRRGETHLPNDWNWKVPVAISIVFGASAAFNAWHAYWLDDQGLVKIAHVDLGFLSMLAHELPESRCSDIWSAVTGSALSKAGLSEESWYHWGPIWLGMIIHKATGLPAIEATLNVGPTIMVTLMVLLAGGCVRALTRWGLGWSLLVGAVSILLLPLPYHLRSLMPDNLPFGWQQHWRDSLLWQFPYQYEGVITLTLLLSWLRGRKKAALLMLVCATLSSPHFVGGAGVAVGTLMIAGLVMRQRSLYAPAAAAVGAILLMWGILHWVIGTQMSTGLHVEDGKGMFGFTLSSLVQRCGGIATDIGIELSMCAICIPGWFILMRTSKNTGTPTEARLLGWLGIAGLCGSLAAYHLFEHEEGFHFVDFPMTVFAMPIATWGLALWASRLAGLWRAIPMILLLIGLGAGVEDLLMRKWYVREKGPPLQVLNELKQVLHGEAYGYYAIMDRPWWIPKNSFTAALLDTHCVRLNPLEEADHKDNYSRFYNSYKIMELVPYEKGKPFHVWSLRLARSLGVRNILTTPADFIPEEIKKSCHIVYESGDYRLYRINETQ